jgi:hypothetical protein
VKPERHRVDSRASEDRVDLDQQQVSHLPLSLRHNEPLPRTTPRRRRVAPGSAPTCRRTSREARSVVNQRAIPRARGGRNSLDRLDVDGPGTLLPGLNLIGNFRALRERPIASAEDRRLVNEPIL